MYVPGLFFAPIAEHDHLQRGLVSGIGVDLPYDYVPLRVTLSFVEMMGQRSAGYKTGVDCMHITSHHWQTVSEDEIYH